MPHPTSAHNVAAYILHQRGTMTCMKLQKLLYYSQAWSLVWDEAPLFREDIEAWANGPVVREIYDVHRGRFQVSDWPRGNASELSDVQQETVDAVLGFYADHPASVLSELTHAEAPWRNARRGIPDGNRSNVIIALGDMAEYYEGLLSGGKIQEA